MSKKKKTRLTLGQDVGLDVSIVVLTGPHEGSRRLEHLGHHVVDQPVLVPDLQFVKLRLVVPAEKTNKHSSFQEPCTQGLKKETQN